MGMEGMIQWIMNPGYEKGRPEWKLLFPQKYLINIQVSHMGWEGKKKPREMGLFSTMFSIAILLETQVN